MSLVLASRLAATAITPATDADQIACHEAARYAREVHDLLAGKDP